MYVELETAITIGDKQFDIEIEGALVGVSLRIDGIWLDGADLLKEQSERAAEARKQIDAKYDRLQERATEDAGFVFRNPSGDPSCGKWVR